MRIPLKDLPRKVREYVVESTINDKSDIRFYTVEDRDLVLARNLSKLQRKEIKSLCIHTHDQEREVTNSGRD